MKNNYEIKEKIVRKGESKVYENWKSVGVGMEDFLSELRWICEDPEKDYGNGKIRLTRELGCTHHGELVRLKRVCDYTGEFVGFYEEETGALWSGPSISCREQI